MSLHTSSITDNPPRQVLALECHSQECRTPRCLLASLRIPRSIATTRQRGRRTSRTPWVTMMSTRCLCSSPCPLSWMQMLASRPWLWSCCSWPCLRTARTPPSTSSTIWRSCAASGNGSGWRVVWQRRKRGWRLRLPRRRSKPCRKPLRQPVSAKVTSWRASVTAASRASSRASSPSHARHTRFMTPPGACASFSSTRTGFARRRPRLASRSATFTMRCWSTWRGGGACRGQTPPPTCRGSSPRAALAGATCRLAARRCRCRCRLTCPRTCPRTCPFATPHTHARAHAQTPRTHARSGSTRSMRPCRLLSFSSAAALTWTCAQTGRGWLARVRRNSKK